jgi:hypothetical protein
MAVGSMSACIVGAIARTRFRRLDGAHGAFAGSRSRIRPWAPIGGVGAVSAAAGSAGGRGALGRSGGVDRQHGNGKSTATARARQRDSVTRRATAKQSPVWYPAVPWHRHCERLGDTGHLGRAQTYSVPCQFESKVRATLPARPCYFWQRRGCLRNRGTALAVPCRGIPLAPPSTWNDPAPAYGYPTPYT